jgi:hypothetical protein
MREPRWSDAQIVQFVYDVFDTLIASIRADEEREQTQVQESVEDETAEKKGELL